MVFNILIFTLLSSGGGLAYRTFSEEIIEPYFERKLTNSRRVCIFLFVVAVFFAIYCSKIEADGWIKFFLNLVVFAHSCMAIFYAYQSRFGKNVSFFSKSNLNKDISRCMDDEIVDRIKQIEKAQDSMQLKIRNVTDRLFKTESTIKQIRSKMKTFHFRIMQILRFAKSQLKIKTIWCINTYNLNQNHKDVFAEMFKDLIVAKQYLDCPQLDDYLCFCLGLIPKNKMKWVNSLQNGVPGITYFVSLILVINPDLRYDFWKFEHFANKYFEFDFNRNALQKEFNRRKRNIIPQKQHYFIQYLRTQ